MHKGGRPSGRLDSNIRVANIGERIREIIHLSDGFIIMPGGYGTLEEIGVIVGGKANKLYDKPIVLFNYHGFYDLFTRFLQEMVIKKFSKIKPLDLLMLTDDIQEAISYNKGYRGTPIPDKYI